MCNRISILAIENVWAKRGVLFAIEKRFFLFVFIWRNGVVDTVVSAYHFRQWCQNANAISKTHYSLWLLFICETDIIPYFVYFVIEKSFPSTPPGKCWVWMACNLYPTTYHLLEFVCVCGGFGCCVWCRSLSIVRAYKTCSFHFSFSLYVYRVNNRATNNPNSTKKAERTARANQYAI